MVKKLDHSCTLAATKAFLFRLAKCVTTVSTDVLSAYI